MLCLKARPASLAVSCNNTELAAKTAPSLGAINHRLTGPWQGWEPTHMQDLLALCSLFFLFSPSFSTAHSFFCLYLPFPPPPLSLSLSVPVPSFPSPCLSFICLSPSLSHTLITHRSMSADTCAHTLAFCSIFWIGGGRPLHKCVWQTGFGKVCNSLMDDMCSQALCVHAHL